MLAVRTFKPVRRVLFGPKEYRRKENKKENETSYIHWNPPRKLDIFRKRSGRTARSAFRLPLFIPPPGLNLTDIQTAVKKQFPKKFSSKFLKKLFFFGKSLPADVYSHVKGKNESFLPIAGNKQTLLPNLPSLSNSLL